MAMHVTGHFTCDGCGLVKETSSNTPCVPWPDWWVLRFGPPQQYLCGACAYGLPVKEPVHSLPHRRDTREVEATRRGTTWCRRCEHFQRDDSGHVGCQCGCHMRAMA